MLTRCKNLIALLLFLALAVPAQADLDQSHINAAVANPARSEADRKRDFSSNPADALAFFGISSGMSVLDLFAGGGYYSELLSYAVGSTGGVVSHNNEAYEEYVGEELEIRFADNRLANVTRLISEANDLEFEASSFDVVMLVLVYHDTYFSEENWPAIDRKRLLAQLHQALKPNGVLAIIDHSAKPGTDFESAQTLHRIDESLVKKDVESAGFKLDKSSDLLRNSTDSREQSVFDENIRRKTDRFVLRFVKR
jgi:predicted methyltransferase